MPWMLCYDDMRRVLPLFKVSEDLENTNWEERRMFWAYDDNEGDNKEKLEKEKVEIAVFCSDVVNEVS